MNRVRRVFHFVTDRHRETPRMRKGHAQYRGLRALIDDGQLTYGGMRIVRSRYVPKNTVFIVDPRHLWPPLIDDGDNPQTSCVVPW